MLRARVDDNDLVARNVTLNESDPRMTLNESDPKQWDVRTVKHIKTFDYIPLLIARMLRARVDDNDLVARNVTLNESDPRLEAPTIAAKPPPSLKELLERKSRFIVPSTDAKSTSGQDLGENVVK